MEFTVPLIWYSKLLEESEPRKEGGGGGEEEEEEEEEEDTAPVASHTVIIEASTLVAVIPDRKDLRILRGLAVWSTTRNSCNPLLPRTRSVCLSLSGSVEEEEIGWPMPDSSDKDILLRKYTRRSC